MIGGAGDPHEMFAERVIRLEIVVSDRPVGRGRFGWKGILTVLGNGLGPDREIVRPESPALGSGVSAGVTEPHVATS